MDNDRFLTHSGRRFRLLSSEKEIDEQLKVIKHLTALKIRINELTCQLHNEYTTTWGNFSQNNAGCGKCSEENAVSYAHTYFLALLIYFKLDYVDEYPIKVQNSTYRVDFRLSTTPNYVEIDSVSHVRGWGKSALENYKMRDQLKDELLGTNLERIKTYDSSNYALPLREQISLIESAFLERAKRNNLTIDQNMLNDAKRDTVFFNHARIAQRKNKLDFFHSSHIIFKEDSFTNLLGDKSDKQDFFCLIHKEHFTRSRISVLKIHFHCPVCQEKIANGELNTYYLDTKKIQYLEQELKNRYKNRFSIKHWISDQKVFFYRTIVFPVFDNKTKKELYIPLRDLVCLPVNTLLQKIKSGEYQRYIINRQAVKQKNHNRIREHLLIEVENIDNKKRASLYDKSKAPFQIYQDNAKEINQLLKKCSDNEYLLELIDKNEKLIKKFIHKTKVQAVHNLACYDRTIVPYFNNQSEYELCTPRHKYVNNKQFLLIKGQKCGHYFYITWNWISVKMNKKLSPIQCQHKECYETFYRTRNPEGRKEPQEKILNIFKDLYQGQYYPTFPELKIMIRESISITHLPSNTIISANVDNFKRGKFRSTYKKLTAEDISKKFPDWVKEKNT